MKKVTIITSPEYEPLVLDSLGKAGVTQLKPVTGAEYDHLKEEDKAGVDYRELYRELDAKYSELKGFTKERITGETPAVDKLQGYVRDPAAKTQQALKEIARIQKRLSEARAIRSNAVEASTHALKEKKDQAEALHRTRVEDLKKEFNHRSERIKLLNMLKGEDLSGVLAVGVVASEVLEHLEKHAEKHEVHIKATPITDHETLVILEGKADQSDWVESIFMVFDVRKISLAGGGSQGQNALAEEERALESLITALPGDGSFDSRIKVIEEAHKVEAASMDEKIKAAEASTHAPANPDAELLAQESKALGEIGFTLKVLLFASNESILVKRTRFYSILQGWTPDGRLEELKAAVKSVTDKTNGKIIVEVEDPSSSDKGVPMLAPRLGSVLQPIWRLTTLRGWPTPTELNPAHISIFIFALQFGLMFGDIGQGALILLLGLFLTRKTKRGLMGRIGTLFLPMGISAIIFGVLYDSIFLKEYLLRDLFGWKHPLPNPVTNTIQLFVLIFQLAVVEVTFGLILNAYNQVVKQKNIAGALGERGLGMFLYVYAIYSAVDVSKGLQPKADLSPILPYMAAGLALSFAEPIIHALLSGHRPGMTQFGEGVGGLMMTFVEGLANLFSFLRVGAFALAHASLGVAAIKLGEAMTLNIGGMNIMPIIGYIVMNMIAMSFELISSTVQSLRLLYYEFMGKFYSGQGTPFVPYTSSEPKNGAVQKQ